MGVQGVCLKSGRDRFDSWVGKIPWRREWQPIPVFLPGVFHGERNLVGYNSWDCGELGMTEKLTLSLSQLLKYNSYFLKFGSLDHFIPQIVTDFQFSLIVNCLNRLLFESGQLYNLVTKPTVMFETVLRSPIFLCVSSLTYSSQTFSFLLNDGYTESNFRIIGRWVCVCAQSLSHV